MSAPFIEIKGLTKKYKQAITPALNELNLEIEKKSIFGLLGPNGAGKNHNHINHLQSNSS